MSTLWRDSLEWDWVMTPGGQRLHHVARIVDPEKAERDWGGLVLTTCGLMVDGRLPGIFSRMGRERCAHCCDRLGWPRGTGSPKNDDALRPLVQARLAPTDSAVQNIEEPDGVAYRLWLEACGRDASTWTIEPFFSDAPAGCKVCVRTALTRTPEPE